MTVYRTKENSDRDQNDNPESDRGQRIFREQDAIHDRTGAVVRSLGGAALFNLNRLLMQWVYRVEVQGLTQLPKQAPFLLTPNHVSLLDPLAIAAVLPHHILEHTYWAGWVGIMFRNRLMRLISRATHVVPIDPHRAPMASLAFGATVLARGDNLVWFPEHERSWNGTVQPFQLGVGLLLRSQPVPAVPVRIANLQGSAAWKTMAAAAPDHGHLRRAVDSGGSGSAGQQAPLAHCRGLA
jgi:hypothetical protein